MQTTIDLTTLGGPGSNPQSWNDPDVVATAYYGFGEHLYLSGSIQYGYLSQTGGILTAGAQTGQPLILSHDTTNLDCVLAGSTVAFVGSIHIGATGSLGYGATINAVGTGVTIDDASHDHGTVSLASSGFLDLKGMDAVTAATFGNGVLTAYANDVPIAQVAVNGNAGTGAMSFAHDAGSTDLLVFGGKDTFGHTALPVFNA
jgi:hypothetical protein